MHGILFNEQQIAKRRRQLWVSVKHVQRIFFFLFLLLLLLSTSANTSTSTTIAVAVVGLCASDLPLADAALEVVVWHQLRLGEWVASQRAPLADLLKALQDDSLLERVAVRRMDGLLEQVACDRERGRDTRTHACMRACTQKRNGLEM
jgi:hypothetical protein